MKKNILWSVVLIIAISFNSIFYMLYEKVLIINIGLNYLTLFLTILVNLFIGFALGADRLLYEIKKSKNQWKIDSIKIYIIGIPTFIISIVPIIICMSDSYLISTIYPSRGSIIVLSQIICGYTITSSFYRERI